MKLKVKPNANQDFKAFEIEARQLNLQQRTELNDKLMDQSVPQNFTFWICIIKENTTYSDDELNEYSLDELVAMASAIIESANKKKLKK